MGERIVEELGHQVTVANARRVKLISQSDSKSDQIDSELLARLGKADVKLLAPIRHRSMEAQSDLAVRIHEAIEKEDQLIERLAKKYPDVELSLATQRGRSAHRSGLPADVGGQESVQVQSNGGCTPRIAPQKEPVWRKRSSVANYQGGETLRRRHRQCRSDGHTVWPYGGRL